MRATERAMSSMYVGAHAKMYTACEEADHVKHLAEAGGLVEVACSNAVEAIEEIRSPITPKEYGPLIAVPKGQQSKDDAQVSERRAPEADNVSTAQPRTAQPRRALLGPTLAKLHSIGLTGSSTPDRAAVRARRETLARLQSSARSHGCTDPMRLGMKT